MAKTKEEKNAYNKAYRAANPGKAKADSAAWRTKNPTYTSERNTRVYRENPEYHKQRRKDYREANRAQVLAQEAKFREENRALINARAAVNGLKYRAANRDKINTRNQEYRARKADDITHQINKREVDRAYWTNRRLTDPEWVIASRIRGCITKGIARGNEPKNGRSTKLLGCTIAEARAHLESQFTEGMSWETYGAEGWHIDHKRPVASFDKTDPNWQFECSHYTNLQPLWAKENRIKSDKWDPTPTAVCG